MKKPKNILFLFRSWHGIGGKQQFGHDVYKAASELTEYNAWHCVPWISATSGPLHLLGIVVYGFQALCIGLWAGVRGYHIHLGDMSLSGLGVCIKRCTGCTLTATAHGLDVLYTPAWYQQMLQRSLPHIDHVITVSRSTASFLEKRGVLADTISVIPNGIWPENALPVQEKMKNQPLQMLYMGRMVPRKGIVWFAEEVFPLLLKTLGNIHLTILGDGPEMQRLQNTIRENNLQGYIDTKGFVSADERQHFLQTADMLIVPNIPTTGTAEGFGIVCIEAGLQGVPVIAANLEGLTDAVAEGKTGLLFSPHNAKDCVRAITTLAHNPLHATSVQTAVCELYSWENLIQNYVSVWSSVLR